MKPSRVRLLQALLVLSSSIFVSGFLLSKSIDFSSALAVSKNKNYWAWLADKMSEKTGKSAYYFKTHEVSEDYIKEPKNECQPAGGEGCFSEFKCKGGRVGIRRADCGKEEKEEEKPEPTPTPTLTPTPTMTPTPTPTITPTPTPTVTPTPTPTSTPGPTPTPTPTGTPAPTPTPTPPQVLAAVAPPRLPKTGADPLELAAGFLVLGRIGLYLVKRFKIG